MVMWIPYFLVSTAYRPVSEGGSGVSSITDPGSSWMYKACLDPTDPGDFTWVEFYDPVDDGNLVGRPEVYYSAAALGTPMAPWAYTGEREHRTSEQSSNKGTSFLLDSSPAKLALPFVRCCLLRLTSVLLVRIQKYTSLSAPVSPCESIIHSQL